MTLLVRDEIDVIDAMLDYHLSHGVDAIIATDNGSIDGTRDVLMAWARRGVLQLLDEAPSDFSQHRWVTRMAQLAHSIHRADWVLHADADELFVPRRHASLKDTLAEIPKEVSVLRIGRHDFVPFDRPGKAPPQAEMLYRKQHSLNLAGRPLPPKVAHRAVPECKITQGNHRIESPGLAAALHFPEIMVYHYPIRTYEQFMSKVKNGGSGYARNRELPSGTGFHKRYWYDLLLRGELEVLYHARYYYDHVRLQQSLEREDLVLDRAAANAILTSQRVDVPSERLLWLTARNSPPSNTSNRPHTPVVVGGIPATIGSFR